MPYTFNPALRARLADNIARFERRAIDRPELRHAAVVIAVVPVAAGGEAGVLLTKRAKDMRRHAGQFALPGGRLDAGETVLVAALRELREEVRLDLAPASIIGLLDDIETRSGFVVTPVVAWAEAAEIEADPTEVARVFKIALSELDHPRIPSLIEEPDGEHPTLALPLPSIGSEVYAPTGAMLYQFREVALRGAATRVAHYGQPRFAWQ